MNTSSTSTLPAAGNASNRPLWAAVGILAFAVLGLGGMLVWQQTRPTANVAAMNPTPTQAIASANTTAAQLKGDDLVEPEPPAKAAPAAKPAPVQKAPKPVVRAPVPAATVVQAPAPAPAAPVCGNCGTITAVTAVQRKGEGSGLGAIGGGVAGAVLGNQVGGGNGRAIATVLGAVGGGFAGNAIEKNVRKVTVYQAQVRMDDGSTRSFEQATSPAVGTRVVSEGGSWRAM
jgi:uncharacterized protein YcfJ